MKKRKGLKKRVTAFFMAIFMVLTMVPQAVSASEIAESLSVTDKKAVTYKNDQGKVVTIHDGDTLNVTTLENGNFTYEGYPSGSSRIEWRTSWEGEEQYKPIWIGMYSGDIAIFNPGSVNAKLTKAATGEELCSFTIIAKEPKVEEIKLYIDDEEVTGSNYTVAGHQLKEIKIKGRYSGSDEYVDFSNTKGISLTSDKDFISYNTYNGASFSFKNPGTGIITVECFGAKASFTATSTYVPVESLKLTLRPEVKMHRLQYSMGAGDNYIGIDQSELIQGLTINPSNSSNYTVKWTGNNDSVASYYDTHSNGFLGHSNGNVTITGSINDNGKELSASCDVNYVFKKLVEGISMKDGKDSFNMKEEESIELPLIYEPNGEAEEDQPSQTAMKWTLSKDGIVKIKQSRGEYDRYASRSFSMTAISQGTVEVTGTPLAAKDGVEPVKFTVTVEEGSSEPPDTDSLVSKGVSSCKSYYSYHWAHDTWKYTDEWDIIALKRTGMSLGENEAAAIESYKSSIASEIADGRLSGKTKPTTLARVALALESIGVDASSFEGFNFYEALLNSKLIDTGSNESIWALIALDAKQTSVLENTKYDRDKLIETILSFQTEDGGFNLSKSKNGGDVDLTAMAIQALSKYQNKENAKEATEKALAFLQSQMEFSCDMNGTSESLAQTIIAVSSLEKDIAEKDNGFTRGKSKNVFVAFDKYKTFAGFKHKKEDEKRNHMSTQQALLALTSYNRVKNHQNTLYDMTDVESENYKVPKITVTGVENNQVIFKKNTKVQIDAVCENEKTENLNVWLNGEKQEGKDGNYTLNLNTGNNNLNIRAVSKNGAVSQISWTLKFSPLNYQKEIDKSIEKTNAWAKNAIQEKEYTLSENALIMTYIRTAGNNKKITDKVLDKVKEGTEFKNVNEWTSTIFTLNAIGVDVNNVYGLDLWKSGDSFFNSLSAKDSIEILTAINARGDQNTPDEISREKLLTKIAANEDGGFGSEGISNVYDTACAVIALTGETDRQNEVEKAIEWIAEHHTSTGGFNEIGSYSELACTAKVMEALCEVGIDFTLDDRFNNEENIYTKLKALLSESVEVQNVDMYRALAAYQRLYKGKNSIYRMDDTTIKPGLTADRKTMEETAAYYLQNMNFDEYSPSSTEAAYLLIRGNRATKAVYNYIDVLKNAIKEKKMTTAREYFFAGLYLKENKMNLADIDGTDMLSHLNELDYTTKDSLGNVKSNATVPMSYALMALNLQTDYETSLREDLISKIQANRVEQNSWKLKGFYDYYSGQFGNVSPKSTIIAMMALKGANKLADVDSLIDYLGGKGTNSYDEKQLNEGYWGDYRKDSNKLIGNLVTTADMVIGIPMVGVNILTDARFYKENGNVENGIRAFYRLEGFSETPDGTEIDAEATVAGYRAILELRFSENNMPGVYDVESERQIDRTALDDKIKEAEGLEKDDYTKETWEVLEKALEETKSATTQKEINLALESLTNSIKGLKEGIEKIRAKAKEELQKYVDIENYEDEQKKAIESTLNDAMKQLDDAKDIVEIESIVTSSKKVLDEIPTRAELEAERELLKVKESAKETLASYKDLSLYQDKEKEELKKIIEEAILNIDAAQNKEDIESIVTASKKALDEIPTRAELEAERELLKIKESAKETLASYKDLSLYQDKEKEELKKIIEEAILNIDATQNKEDIEKIVADAKAAMDSIKVSEQINKEKEQETSDSIIDDGVKTGDNNSIGFMICLLVLSVGSICVVESLKRKSKIR